MQALCSLESSASQSTSPKRPAGEESEAFGGEPCTVEEQTDEESRRLPGLSDDFQAVFDEVIHSQQEKKVTEYNSSWGDFEGFGDSLAKSESFNYTLKALGNSPESKHLKNDAHSKGRPYTPACGQCEPGQLAGQHDVTEDGSPVEGRKHYANVFKSIFPVTPVQEPSESIKSFEQLLTASEEENELVKLMKTTLGMDSDSWGTWRTVNDAKGSSCLGYPCKESRKNLLLALRIHSSGKDVTGGLDAISECNTLNGLDRLSKGDNRTVDRSKTLIQTKLLVPPDSKNGHGFSYQLYLQRAPSNGHKPAIIFSSKKSFFALDHRKIKS